jgi:hypothetical protein
VGAPPTAQVDIMTEKSNEYYDAEMARIRKRLQEREKRPMKA